MATATEPTVLDGLKDQRAEIASKWDELIDSREQARTEFEARLKDEDESKRPTDEERDAFNLAEEEYRAANDDMERQFKEIDARVDTLTKRAERRKLADDAGLEHEEIESQKDPLVYRQDNAQEHSFFKDLIGSENSLRGRFMPEGGWSAADERRAKHGKQMEDTVESREAAARRAAEDQTEAAEREFRKSLGLRGGLTQSPFEMRAFEQRANPSRAPGAGGEYVPPLWLVETGHIEALRAGRVISTQCRNMPVPLGTDTIKLPKIKLGAEVAPQLQDNAGVASRDIETEYVEAAVKTLAGQQDVAIQLIEQSPGQMFDRVVQEDLLADYHLKVDQNVSYGQGLNASTLNAGTIKGLFPSLGSGANEWKAGHRESSSAVSPQVLIAAMGANWSHIAKERFNTQNVHHFINPAFGAYLASATDSESEKGRLLLNNTDFPNFNTSGLLASDTQPEGFLFKTPLGPSVFQSANIPPILPSANSQKTGSAAEIVAASNKAAEALITSGTEAFSYCLTMKGDDVWFFESDLRVRVLPEVVSGTLQIRFQVYAYIALLVRYGPSLQFAGGKPFKVGTSFSSAPTEPTLGGYAF
jgi:hypothetical protein